MSLAHTRAMRFTGREVLLAGAVRTPIGKSCLEKGWYRDTHPNEMLAGCYDELLARADLPAREVDDLVIGCRAPVGAQSRNIGRNAWLHAGYPPEVPAVTLDRRDCSEQTAVEMGAGAVGTGTHDIVITGGVEHTGCVPINSTSEFSKPYDDPWPVERRDQYAFVHQGEAAELIAERWGIERVEMDEFAVRSHLLAARAHREGRFAAEMLPMELIGEIRSTDQGIRPDTDLSALAALETPFRVENGRITAGTLSPISDGAAAVLLASRVGAEEFGLNVRFRLLDQTTVGVESMMMLTGPIRATRKLLDRNGLSVHDIDLIEINETFASMVLAWKREFKPDLDRVNVNGGAIALGRPVGATGARLMATLVAEMERRDVELGLVTMCCGGDLGTATLVERVG